MFLAPYRLGVLLRVGFWLTRWWHRLEEYVRTKAPRWRGRVAELVKVLGPDSVKGRIVTFAVVATLLPSLATAWIAYSQTKRSITDKISEGLERASAQVSRELELWTADVLTDIRVFATSYEVTENLERITRYGATSMSGMAAVTRLNDYLGAVEPRFENYSGLRVVDVDGNPLAVGGASDEDFEFPSAWRNVLRGGAARLGDPHDDAHHDEQIITAVAPSKSPDGTVLGAVVATVDLHNLGELIREFAPDNQGALYVLSAHRRPILGFSPAATPSNRSAEATADLYDEAPRPVQYKTHLGDRRVGALNHVRGPGWGVVAELPRDLAYGRITRLRNLTVVMVSFILLFVAAVAHYLAAVIVKPLHRLTVGASAVAAGDLTVDLPVHGGGEVGYLTRVFNDMVARLREGRRQLAEINETLVQKNEELAQLSSTDSLTGLHNRRHLMEALASETIRSARKKRTFSVLMLDVDHFKNFNDRYGHQVGDDALAAVGGVLRRATREMDCPARYGGEEFLVLLPETGFDSAGEVAERIRSQIADLVFGVNGNQASVTVSVGLAEYPRHGESFERVIQAADAALYEAKRVGRNRIIVAAEPSQEVLAE